MGTKIEAWKIFLKGRIAQEKGNNEEALKAFDQALEHDPENPSFLNARSNALLALNPEEALVARIQRGYELLAKTYVGENDRPAPWIEGLERLLNEAETVSPIEEPMIWMAW
jgi:tetratricopeptide (TPR) repeat protein